MDNDNIENLEWMQIKFEVDYDNDEVTFYVGESENLNDLGTLPMSLGAIDKFVCRVGWEPAPNTFEVRIDSLSWSWDPDYEVGDLLEVDSSFELNYTEQNMPNGDYYYAMVATNEFGSSDISNCVSVTVSSSLGFPIPEILIISIVIVVLLVIGISIIILYKKKGKISRSKKTKKSVDLTAEKIKKLSNLFLMSKNVRIESVAKMLGLTHVELLTFLIENRTTLKGLVIDGDYITMAETSDVNEFVGFLDKQFESWQNKEKTADGKKI
ncbi:MAG: hypothetical protein GY870_00865 [archaeon]|nr:hypothetical protein [archaeon]